MGDVYLAKRDGPGGFNKLVVVKQLRPALAADPTFVEMFLDEARLAARLSHPNVVQTHEISSDGGAYFMAMEYLDGQPLQQIFTRFRQRGGLPLAAGLRILAEALAGLHYAHELKDYDGTSLAIVHRDISPHNLFLTYEGQVKLVDFGIAKTADSSTDTRLGTLKGKVGYMAPEQARGEVLDRRADVYAAGVILWEILTGQRMWRERSEVAILTRLAAGDVPSLGKAGVELDPELLLIGSRALGPRRDERYASAAAFQRDIELYLADLPEALDTRRIGFLVADAFQQERARFREIIRAQLADPASLPVQLATASSTLSPASGSAASGPDVASFSEGRFAASGAVAITPSPPAVSIPSTSRTLEAETVVLKSEPQRAAKSTPRARAVALVAVAAIASGLWVAASRDSDAGANPAPARAAVGAVTRAKQEARPVPPPASGACSAANKPLVEISGDIVTNATLGCANDYLLKFTTFVKSGVTLTIEKGTTIYGDTATRGTLVVQPLARLIARGSAEEPIVFTSENLRAGSARPGDWGGVIILGHAPVNLRGVEGKPSRGRIEGITTGGDYGGSDPGDDSGVLEYVRIEFSGTELAPNNEINGLTLGGVGAKTTLRHVEVRDTADDCFEFFGGTVNGAYLACVRPGDDGFDWDYGYRGKLQFIVSVSAHDGGGENSGLEGDNDPNGSMNEPTSEPTIYNATLCGPGAAVAKPSYGMLLRRSTRARIGNALVTGFGAGLDVRDRTSPDIRSSAFFGNGGADFGVVERAGVSEGPLADDDGGFDEADFLREAGRNNQDRNPGLARCDGSNPRGPKPREPLHALAARPPDDGFFDPNASFLGAFRDQDDAWDAGRWLVWK